MANTKRRTLTHAFDQMKSNKPKLVKPVVKLADAVRPKTTVKPTKNIKSKTPVDKKGFHVKNLHCDGYDFPKLIENCPALEPFVHLNVHEKQAIDFADPKAVKALNSALLKLHYNIDFWDIPKDFLCPPIPGRVDYIHYVADLLGKAKKSINILDIGTGSSGIYPILGIQAYGWNFVGSDIDPVAIANVNTIIERNDCLQGKFETRLQSDSNKLFQGIIKNDEQFDVSICNPPFHSSEAEANKGSQRKLRNLARNRGEATSDIKSTLNFGGQNAELWCEGGERDFIFKMIHESVGFASQCSWFTSLVSKKENLKPCKIELQKSGAVTVKTIEMAQGNKVTRILAWSFRKNN